MARMFLLTPSPLRGEGWGGGEPLRDEFLRGVLL